MYAVVFLAATAALAQASSISCKNWVDNSGTVCFNSVNNDLKCNPATFTEKNSCSEKYCCAPAAISTSCEAWVDDKNIKCPNGLQDNKCWVGGSKSNQCTEGYCCKPYVKVLTNCYLWTKSGSKCDYPRNNNWQKTLKDYECFEKVDLGQQGTLSAGQNGLGPCSTEQCCALITSSKPTPSNDCKNYPPNVVPVDKNYDWLCQCYAQANKIKCSSGKYLQVGKECTRYSGKYPNIPKCMASNCCGSDPFVQGESSKSSNPAVVDSPADGPAAVQPQSP